MAAIETQFKGRLSIGRIEYYLSQSRNNLDSDTVILGSTGKYDIIWKVNEHFIDEQIVAGKNILLSNNPNKGYYFSDGTRRFYQRELDYITSQGYEFEKISDGLWQAIRK